LSLSTSNRLELAQVDFWPGKSAFVPRNRLYSEATDVEQIEDYSYRMAHSTFPNLGYNTFQNKKLTKAWGDRLVELEKEYVKKDPDLKSRIEKFGEGLGAVVEEEVEATPSANAKTTCSHCGSEIRRKDLSRHKRTLKCINYEK